MAIHKERGMTLEPEITNREVFQEVDRVLQRFPEPDHAC